ncbi:hypothetical protein [Williamwhitmania taraxaci]|uniref:V/A-type H+-transporting ATPase subunit E n=1 Tax=Williamwhitmania taraxaci TaxID=1640674 RepID=A0A1G6HW45_9BACT|nr:hypothetical protein [Williamwhitmania taraxaci]SDB98358.1 V/A-type H+-transporting ATPase subunit E [Williamwhitmania taraxaci]
MQNKLHELTEKIYNEGVNKGAQEAEHIIAKAKEDARLILNNARKDADLLIAKANKDSEELRKNSESEIRLAGKQTLNALKQQITSLIETSIVNPPMKEAINEVAFIKQIIDTAIAAWNPQKNNTVDLTILLPKDMESKLQSMFVNSTGEILHAGVELIFDDSFSAGFKIGPKGAGYLISFTDSDFENLFKAYIRPRLVELLFGGK